MALTFQDYTANGTAVSFAIPFDRIRDVHVKVFYASTEVTTGWSVVGNNVVFVSPPPNGTVVRVRRITDFSARLVDYVDGSRLNEVDLDTDSKQAFYLIQENRDINDVSMVKNSLGNWEADFDRIQSVATPVENNDAANKSYVDQTANNFASYGVAAPTTRWAFTGNGTAVAFAITGATLISSTYYLVTVNGVVRDPALYTVTPNTLTFATAPANESAIVVVLLGYPRVAQENSIGTLSLQDNAVTSNKILQNAITSIKILTGAVTAIKLASTLDLSDKTLTLPTGNVTNDKLGNDISAAKLVTGTLPADRIGSGAITPIKLAQPYTLMTAKAYNWNGLSTNTVIDFTGIPTWAKRVTVMFDEVSLSGTTSLLIQLGDPGGVENANYRGGGARITAAAVTAATFTAGFGFNNLLLSNTFSGSTTITNFSGNTWVASGTLGGALGTEFMCLTSGSKVLSGGPLNTICVASFDGTSTFDTGSISVSYEG